MNKLPKRITSALVTMSVAWLTTTALVLGQSAAARTVWSKVYTEDQAKRGQTAYAKSCAPCHGDDLMGMGNNPVLVDEDFLFFWADKDKSVGDLFEHVQNFMPSDAPNSLPPDVYRDIVAYLLKANKFPSGSVELSTEVEDLKQIKITRTDH